MQNDAQQHRTVEQLIEWLADDEEGSRAWRAERLQELLNWLPVSSDGMSFMGGDQSSFCFDEIRLCYVHGLYLAVVVLCLMYVERELAAQLYAAGWNKAAKANLTDLLKKAHEDGWISDDDRKTFADLARVRNSHAHFRGMNREKNANESLLHRIVAENSPPAEIIAKDARRALRAIARLVKHQASVRVNLG